MASTTRGPVSMLPATLKPSSVVMPAPRNAVRPGVAETPRGVHPVHLTDVAVGVVRQERAERRADRDPVLQQGDPSSADLRVHARLRCDPAREGDEGHQRPDRRPRGRHGHAEGADRGVVGHDGKRAEVQHDYHPSP